MQEISLSASLGLPNADAAVRELIRVYEESFPEQIVSYYVEGSYADHSYMATSDIDLTIVFHPHVTDKTRQEARQLWSTSPRVSTMELDITVVDEESLRGGMDPMLKLGSQLIYGTDIRDKYPILPIAEWARQRMHAAYWLLGAVYQRPLPVRQPLSFPDAQGEFYGYANRSVRLLDGREVASTRNLIRTIGWAATARLALEAGQYAVRKRACVQLYHQYINDEWSSFLEDLTAFCQQKWHYLLPETEVDRQHLRSLCERALDFEEHFLTHYKLYLLAQLQSEEQESRRFAHWIQEQLPLDDAEIREVLQSSSSKSTKSGLHLE